jgi:hypothetical protein
MRARTRPWLPPFCADLKAAGYSVGYDGDFVAGERFGDRINAQIDAAKAVVVLWSKASVKSDWVIHEANRAREQKKLIPLLLPPVTVIEIPPPFASVLNIPPHGNLEALKAALALKHVEAA